MTNIDKGNGGDVLINDVIERTEVSSFLKEHSKMKYLLPSDNDILRLQSVDLGIGKNFESLRFQMSNSSSSTSGYIFINGTEAFDGNFSNQYRGREFEQYQMYFSGLTDTTTYNKGEQVWQIGCWDGCASENDNDNYSDGAYFYRADGLNIRLDSRAQKEAWTLTPLLLKVIDDLKPI